MLVAQKIYVIKSLFLQIVQVGTFSSSSVHSNPAFSWHEQNSFDKNNKRIVK